SPEGIRLVTDRGHARRACAGPAHAVSRNSSWCRLPYVSNRALHMTVAQPFGDARAAEWQAVKECATWSRAQFPDPALRQRGLWTNRRAPRMHQNRARGTATAERPWRGTPPRAL